MNKMGAVRSFVKTVKSFIHNNIPAFVKPFVMDYILSRKLLVSQRNAAECYRIKQGLPHDIKFFHDMTDPYSAIAIQTIPGIIEKYNVKVTICLVGPPQEEFVPQYEKLKVYSRKDAELLAWRFGLKFVDPKVQPSPRDTEEALVHALQYAGENSNPRKIRDITQKLWEEAAARPSKQKEERVATTGIENVALREHMASADYLRRDLEHYMGSMFYYGKEWYWGIDRMYHLEKRLIDLKAVQSPGDTVRTTGNDDDDFLLFPCPEKKSTACGPLAQMPHMKIVDESAIPTSIAAANNPRKSPYKTRLSAKKDKGVEIQYFFSFRSPYSAISAERVFAVGKRLGVPVRLRFVLPMVMRGLPVPEYKQIYIIKDVAREAHVRDIPFGHAYDPVGHGVERALSLVSLAEKHGRGEDYVIACMRMIWSEATNPNSEAGMKAIAAAAGLPWSECADVLDAGNDTEWRAQAEKNREDLFKCGLWGVPSFQVNGFAVFGQDRIWAVEEAVKRELDSM